MYEVKSNAAENRIHVKLSGSFTLREARDFAGRLKAASDAMNPGFTLLSDMREFDISEDGIKDIFSEMQEHMNHNGLAKVARVMSSDSDKRVYQTAVWANISSRSGVIAKVEQFLTIEEAQNYLNASE